MDSISSVSFPNEPLISWTCLDHFFHHFWVAKKFSTMWSTDQRFIQKRNTTYRIHTLTETTVDVALSRSRYLFFCYHIGQNDHFSRGTPSAPLDLKAAIVSSRFVTLSWSPPKTSKEPLNGYSIYYKQVKNFVQPFISVLPR